MKANVMMDTIRDFIYGMGKDRPTELTLAMPFEHYHELIFDFSNMPNLYASPDRDSFLIKHISLDGVLVHLVDGNLGELEVGGPKPDKKFFVNLEFKAPEKRQAKVIQMQTLPHRA